jgi:hypothetical protein
MLSDVQAFSKVYYKKYYKKPVTSKWCNTYIAHHHRIKGDLGSTVVDEKNMEQQVSESIWNDHIAGLLDVTIDAVSGANGEEDGDEDDEDDGEDQNQKDTRLFSDGVNLPQVPLWYRNALTRDVWEQAGPSQKDAVEKYKNHGRKTAALGGDETGEGEDDQQKVTRLGAILRFITSYLW